MSDFERLTWDELQPAFDLSYSVWDVNGAASFAVL
jgi:hypothetical protein